MFLFYGLGLISIWFGIQSLISGFRYAAYVRREMSRRPSAFTPFVSVIAPGRGLESGLAENIQALLKQDYPAFEILFVLDRADDPAAVLIRNIVGERAATKIVFSGPALESGQKVHNLRVAVREIDARCEVLVFADTDARPSENWLRDLVSPLADADLGASTGYRWFVPIRGGLASRLRSVWNASIASALGEDGTKNFCWGGATAIRRSTFEELKISDRWRGTVSDDFTVTRVLHEANLPIHFTPQCLTASVGDCGFHELLEFTTRQIQITRVYAAHLWKAVLLGSLLFAIVFISGSLLVVVRAALGLTIRGPLIVIVAILLLGVAKSFIRWRVIRAPLRIYRGELERDLAGQLLLWPFASLLYLYNAIIAGFLRTIKWRGITYELKSATEAVIIAREL